MRARRDGTKSHLTVDALYVDMVAWGRQHPAGPGGPELVDDGGDDPSAETAPDVGGGDRQRPELRPPAGVRPYDHHCGQRFVGVVARHVDKGVDALVRRSGIHPRRRASGRQQVQSAPGGAGRHATQEKGREPESPSVLRPPGYDALVHPADGRMTDLYAPCPRLESEGLSDIPATSGPQAIRKLGGRR